jgi:hypothetical protein
MKLSIFMTSVLFFSIAAASPAVGPPVAPNGIAPVQGYRDWKLIAPSFRSDKGHVRAILGNDKAVQAFGEGRRPFPDGAMLVKIAWSTKKHPSFPVAVVPENFIQVEFMIKDAAKYRETGGWGFARFIGDTLAPYGKDAGFVRECFGCHTPVSGNDFVFTGWGTAPSVPVNPEGLEKR